MSKKIYVLYHGGCPDGFGAAWAAHRFLGDSAEYIPVYHETPGPDYNALPDRDYDGAEVYICDFAAYSRETLMKLHERAHRVVILDHHQTEMSRLHDLEFAQFDMSRSGAMMAWDHFFPGQAPPKLLRWVQERDLWKFESPESADATAALRSYPFDFDVWDRLMEDPSDLILRGKIAGELTAQTVEMICKQATFMNIGGYEVPVVNATCHWSEVGRLLADSNPDRPFAGSWYQLANGKLKWSLRANGDFDVSSVAKLFGGGGHKAAAGFETPIT